MMTLDPEDLEGASGHVGLARAVILSAVEDFTRQRDGRMSALLAGEFLLVREDLITRFWFAVAGIDVAAFRSWVSRHRPEWLVRLAALREEPRRSTEKTCRSCGAMFQPRWKYQAFCRTRVCEDAREAERARMRLTLLAGSP